MVRVAANVLFFAQLFTITSCLGFPSKYSKYGVTNEKAVANGGIESVRNSVQLGGDQL